MTEGDVLARLRRLEDERDIAQLLAGYGPLVDTGQAEAVADLWEQEGRYDVDEVDMQGRDDITAMVRSRAHQGWVDGGCAHLLGPARIAVDGDTAEAVGYSMMVVHDAQGFRIRRVTANHWSLRRHAGTWRRHPHEPGAGRSRGGPGRARAGPPSAARSRRGLSRRRWATRALRCRRRRPAASGSCP